MTSNTPSYQRYWGKAQDEHRYHLLPYHCLDVAACGVTLLRHISPWRDKLTALTGLDDKELEIRVGIFFALHDLGKFSTGFQNLRPDLLQTLQDKQSDKPYGNGRHDTLGYLLWRKKLKRDLIDRGISPPARRRGLDGTDFWMMAVTGHHGRPPAEPNLLLKDAFDFPQDLDAAADFIRDVLRLFETEQLPNCDPAAITNGQDSPFGRTQCARSGLRQGWRSIKPASWWLAGLAVLADWLGSNTDFFPYCSESIPLPDYWSQALNRAEQAVDATELHPTSPADRFTLTDCFPEPPTDLTPTPLQRLVEELPLGHGPQLFILEDVTGAGKTEATLILAQRLLRQKSASGLYMGLPTMATANSMYRRLGSVYRRLYADNSRPSLVLAHGRTDLVWDFHESVLPTASAERDYGDETEPAGARCNAWLADNRKKALLAEVGVGTVDQALLAILASRHQSLRLLGLMDKILIVDEVHACDAYMNCLLEHLLEAHAMAGGSAILLSATLSRDQRRRLAAGFAKGANFNERDLECNDFPLLTHLHASGVTERPMDTRPEVKRHVRVTTAKTSEAVETVLARSVEHGGCACWIRNTVNDARESFEWLRQRHPDWKLDLFHARFAFADRLEIENRNLTRFGKHSGPADRQGSVLIATQVVEQSLDLDFDVLVSDLAPIDLIIQRAGRLHRHSRDESGQRIEGKDRRGEPVITLYTPPWQDDPRSNWLRDHLPGTAAVYEAEDGRLWLGLKLLREAGGITLPEDARRLIEGVYGPEPAIPPGLEEKSLEANIQAKAKRSIAELKTLHLEAGYRAEGSWLDEDIAPTRLGEPTRTVYLAYWDGNHLRPWHGDGFSSEDWLLSALNVRQSQVCDEVIPDGLDSNQWQRLKEKLPGKGKWGVLLALTQAEDGNWHGRAKDGDGRQCDVYYHPEQGLIIP